MFKFIAKQIRKIAYRKTFNKLPAIKGLNFDKHEQVFRAFFNAEEKALGYK